MSTSRTCCWRAPRVERRKSQCAPLLARVGAGWCGNSSPKACPCFAGGLLGVLLALAGTGALATLAPSQIPRVQSAHVDGMVLVFALAATLAAGLLFGLAPAWRASRIDLNRAIKDADASGRTHRGLRGTLAVIEIALAFVLAVGAGLMVKNFWRLMTVGAGYDPHSVLTLSTSTISPRYRDNEIGYHRTVLERLRATPGIESAAMTGLMPMDFTVRRSFYREDLPLVKDADAPLADPIAISPDYLRVMRIPLKRGRAFTERDTETTAQVALINETCMRAQFPDGNPIGKHIKVGWERNDGRPWMTIVGVVGDVRQDGIDQPVDMQVYVALNQGAEPASGCYRLVARTAGDPMRMDHVVRRVFQEVDSGSLVWHVKPLEGYFAGKLAGRTFALALLTFFVCPGSCFGRCGDLWRNLLFRGAANAGARNSCGAGRRPARTGVDGSPGVADTRDGGPGNRPRCVAVVDQAAHRSAVRG